MVVSTFGVMFTPDQDKAAAELLRVCKAGGKIGLANWTPEGFIGQLFKTLGKHMPPPAGVKSPALWGTQARLNEMFAGAASIDARAAHVRVPLPARRSTGSTCSEDFYGPMLQGLRARSTAGKQDALAADLIALVARIQSRDRRHHGGAQRISRSGRHALRITRLRAKQKARSCDRAFVFRWR